MSGIIAGRIHYQADSHAQRVLRVQTICGFAVEVFPDRCLDMGDATYHAMPVVWRNEVPLRHPADLAENTWPQRFIGGLLATCGLDNVGPSCVERGEEFPQHGRISGEPAHEVRYGTRELRGRRIHWIRGEIMQPGTALVLQRRIAIADDTPVVRVTDTVRNDGAVSEPLMVQYHCNFGAPLVAPGGHIVAPDTIVTPRDSQSAAALVRWREIEAPQPGERERVFRHEQPQRRWSEASLTPPPPDDIPFVTVRARRDTLPYLWQWRVFSTEKYVIGLEPANCAVKPRDAARASGTLPLLHAGKRIRYGVEIAFRQKEEG